MSKSSSPWLAALVGAALSYGGNAGFEAAPEKPAPAQAAEAPEAAPARTGRIIIESDSPVELLVEGDSKGYNYTFQLRQPYYERYRKLYSEVRVRVRAPKQKIDFNEVYNIKDGVREKWRPIEETAMRVVKAERGFLWKNVPEAAIFEVYAMGGTERLIHKSVGGMVQFRSYIERVKK